MNEFVIELILIAAIIVPLVADSLEPAQAVNRHGSGRFSKRRRSH
jgi:hypothetical protein